MKDFKMGEIVTQEDYELAFDDGHNNGYGFPCDKKGNVMIDEDNIGAKENYEWCLAHKERFVRAGEVIVYRWSYRENNSGICNCGNKIELYNEYLGGCECPHCGQWWNLFGQELTDPSTWVDEDDYEEKW